MHINWKSWTHVTKLDPEKHLSPEQIRGVVTSGTDALMLSGTLNVTRENTKELLHQVAEYGLPLVLEPAGPEVVIRDGIDLLFVPSVLNTRNVEWIVGKHTQWVLQQEIEWDRVVPEAYIVLNPNSSVGKVTAAQCTLSPKEAAAFATVADRYFHFPIVYIEYSGMYGDPAIVRAVCEALDTSVLYYGGGIDSPEKAAEMARFADTIVVGNAVYEKGIDVLRATVRAVI
ncbi:MAG: phosphoglycerol geranylgeranyltransferase [Methanolinea sp.]|nr:phosphoglycerol geranylgeranyltransferase [Methanolinea sp.]